MVNGTSLKSSGLSTARTLLWIEISNELRCPATHATPEIPLILTTFALQISMIHLDVPLQVEFLISTKSTAQRYTSGPT